MCHNNRKFIRLNDSTFMHSIRTKSTIVNSIAMALSIGIVTALSGIYIANLGHNSSEQTMRLLCETGKNNIDYYLDSVEQSADAVSGLINNGLDNIPDDELATKLHEHVENARTIFNESVLHANGVYTYYYRLDPEYTKLTGETGFWYADLDGKGFVEQEVTDISDDKNECVWFYTPKETGKSLWLAPYITDTLDLYVISYNVPVYRHEQFVGVVGIEVDYTTLGEQIKDIKVQETGFAYIIENDNYTLIYHPDIDLIKTPADKRPPIPTQLIEAIKADEHHVVYKYEGQSKHASWLKLNNAMSIVVAAPSSEVVNIWLKIVLQILIISFGILGVFILFSVFYTRKITQPLKELTDAADELNNGNYKVRLVNKSNDEIGVLTTTMNKLVKHLDEYIDDLNNLAYVDTLTETSNKSAFDVAIQELEQRIKNKEDIEFAVAIFDCDDLKILNDTYGHDKGNVYLKNTSNVISTVFRNSKVYRIGGDEFAVILTERDYMNRDELAQNFHEKCAEICAFAKEPWKQVKVSMGLATYDPNVDLSSEDVVIHADHLMYEEKRIHKKNKANNK